MRKSLHKWRPSYFLSTKNSNDKDINFQTKIHRSILYQRSDNPLSLCLLCDAKYLEQPKGSCLLRGSSPTILSEQISLRKFKRKTLRNKPI